jgi:hypothetical protein
MKTTGASKPTKKRLRRPAAKANSLPYGIKPRPLPKGHSVVGDLHGRDFAPGADLALVEAAYASRNP